MAELKQEKFGVQTGFQQITPHKEPDFREENIKAGIGSAVGIGKSVAAEEGKTAAKTLTGTDLSVADVNRNVDIFENELAGKVTDAQIAGGGTVSAREISEIKDATLNQINLSSRGLQEAINRGVISHLEATARANISLQRASNSLIGSLFQSEFRNAFSRVTGNPAGSPALSLTKSPAEIQKEANRKAIVEANAARTKTIQAQAAKDGSTFDQAEFKVISLEVIAQNVAKNEALDKENLRSDEQKLRQSGMEFAVAVSPLMDNITAAVVSGQGLDPNEIASLKQNVKVISDQIINSHISKGMGSKAQKALRESASLWVKDQEKYIEDISLGKITKETQELISNSAKNLMSSEMPLVYAISTFNPQLAQTLGLMEPQTRQNLVERLGLDIDKLTNISDEFLSLRKVIDPNTKATPSDSGKLPATMSLASGEQNKKIIDGYVDGGGALSDLASEWKAAPAVSLKTIADNLGSQIEIGDKNSVEVGVAILNESVGKYNRLIADYPNTEGTYSVDFKRSEIGAGLPSNIKATGALKPIISFPNGVPEAEQEILKQLYKALDSTPSLWQEEFIDTKDVFENMLNQGFRFDAANIGGSLEGKRDVFTKGVKEKQPAPKAKPTKDIDDKETAIPRDKTGDRVVQKPSVLKGADFLERTGRDFLSRSSTARVGKEEEVIDFNQLP